MRKRFLSGARSEVAAVRLMSAVKESSAVGERGGWGLNPAPLSAGKPTTGVNPLARGLAIIPALTVAIGLACLSLAAWLAPVAQAALTHPFVSSFGPEGPGKGVFGEVQGVAVDQTTGDVFVYDADSKSIHKFSAAGVPLEFSALKSNAIVTGGGQGYDEEELAVDSSAGPAKGDLYLAEGSSGNVAIYDSETGVLLGQLTEKVVEEEKEKGTTAHWGEPCGVAVDPAGHVYVGLADGYVNRYAPTASPVKNTDYTSALSGVDESFGGGEICNVAVDSAEDVYVQKFSAGPVRKYPRLEFGGLPATGSEFAGLGTTLAVAPASNDVYIDQQNEVAQYGPPGELLDLSGTAGPGALSGSVGVAVTGASGKETVYAASGGNSAVVNIYGPAVLLADVSTAAVGEVGITTATAHGSVNPDGVELSGCVFEYKTAAEASFVKTAECEPKASEIGKGTSPVAVTADLSALAPGTTYDARLAASNANGTNITGQETFTTLGRPRVCATESEAASRTGVTLTGCVDPDGLASKYHFEYGETTSYGASTPEGELTEELASEHAVIAPVTGLKPLTTYHYRLVASNSAGAPVDGPDQTFSTVPALRIDGLFASEVADTTATLKAQINPLGADTHYYFQYGTEDCAEHACTSAPSPPGGDIGSGETDQVAGPVSLENLTPDTVYHYRVIASNEFGTVEAPDHTFTTQVAGRQFTMLDGRQWELVSPPNKYGSLIGPQALLDMIQAAASGDALTYAASAPTEAHPQGYDILEQVLSARGPSGWTSRDISPPVYGPATGAVPGNVNPYMLFSEDLSSSVLQPYSAFAPAGSPQSLSPEATEQTPFARDDYLNGNVDEPCEASCYKPMVTAANTPPGTHFEEVNKARGCPPLCGPSFDGASADLGSVVISSTAALTGDMEASGRDELYEWTAGRPAGAPLALVSLLPRNGKGEELATTESGLGSHDGAGDAHAVGAVSEDGSRVIWHSGQNEHLYLRDLAAGHTVQLDAPAAGVITHTNGSPLLQFASGNDERVLFTDGQELTNESGRGGGAGDLYECVVPTGALRCELHDLTPAGGGGEAAEVQGVLGASRDGSWVYFVANGILANNGEPVAGAVHGECGPFSPPAALCNLYVRHEGVTSLVALLSNQDEPVWQYDLEAIESRVSPNGRWLAFMSARALAGYDNRDAVSAEPDEEIYEYHAPQSLGTERGTLACASCNPSGARPDGFREAGAGGEPGLVDGPHQWSDRWLAALLPWGTSSRLGLPLYQSRYLSDSGRLFFNTADALVPGDVNGTEDVYEYEPQGDGTGASRCGPQSASKGVAFKPARPFSANEQVGGRAVEAHGEEGAGCVGLVSSGASSDESDFLDASESGDDVFFLTTARLSPLDTDTARDVYDAHACTSESPCITPVSSPPPCTTADACRAAPSPQPQQLFGAGPTETLSAPGNSTPPPPVVTKKTVKCKRHFVKNKKNKCVKKKTKKRAKRASRDRRTK
jgi:hypothetical protein